MPPALFWMEETMDWELKTPTRDDVKAFLDDLCAEDWFEMKVGFGAKDKQEVLEEDTEDCDGFLGRWILYLGGEPCVFFEAIRDENDDEGVRVWSHTSNALARHKKTYVKVVRKALGESLCSVAPWAKRVWAITWKHHPCVNKTLRRVMGAEKQFMIDGTNLIVWRLLWVEEDLFWARYEKSI